jgi:hypothetical protein
MMLAGAAVAAILARIAWRDRSRPAAGSAGEVMRPPT